MTVIPPEVQTYLSNGRRKITTVTPNDDYSLTLTLDDGAVRIYEMGDNLTGVLAVLRNQAKFHEVFIDAFGNVAWDIDRLVDSDVVFENRIDLSADNAYIYGRCISGTPKPYETLMAKAGQNAAFLARTLACEADFSFVDGEVVQQIH